MSIYFEKATVEELSFDYEAVAGEVIRTIMDYFHCPYEYTVNLYLENPEEVQRINREFREMDKVTDVLSFPNLTFETEGDFSFLEKEETTFDSFDPETGELVLGDIIICQQRMKEQALEYGHSEKREFAFLTAHSMLHLLGFDHMEEQQRIRMEQLQEEVLQILKITRDSI